MKKTYLEPSLLTEKFDCKDVMEVSLHGEGADIDVGGLFND